MASDFGKLKGPPILCLDFDGVLHSYSSGWHGARNIPDPPVPGAIQWIRSLLDYPPYFKLAIYSSRSRYWGGRRAMKNWLLKHGLYTYEVKQIEFPLMKPPAFLQIDDRAVTFTGEFPTVEEMKAFKPWNKRG